ncbi:MAG: hypothetical protein JXR51_09550 [Bacteroidales bacterium]|nr:hypothetical protein [Bacteroidales bacterium]MBN2757409.1 hypothetical protein [Bacteroidales bacterium]
MRKKLLFILFTLLISNFVSSQPRTNEDETSLYASTKQINQFIRRFNGEEDLHGNRLYPENKNYRSTQLRKKYLSNIFDNQNFNISNNLKNEFIKDILNSTNSKYFDFYGNNWFAEISTDFLYNGKTENIILYLQIEKETGGYKWSFINAYFPSLDKEFKTNPPTTDKFIHPMSHELEFMNLRKIFIHNKEIEHYAFKNYKPDYLSLFFLETKRGKLQFVTVNELKFHVFQIKDWYFEIQNFNRKGENTGWLISNLIKIPEKDKTSLINLITHNTN